MKYQRRREVEQPRSVSLFTREWIEMLELKALGLSQMSPSLRGSGLKWIVGNDDAWLCEGLPLYEGVD